MFMENEELEFKLTLTKGIYKEIVAFANTNGGTILIGVDDSGNVVSLENIDEVYTQLTNGVRDNISPDITMFIKYSLENNEMIRVEVGEGTNKPYFFNAKGIKPSGVYVRQGTSSVPETNEQIKQMIKVTDGDSFESTRALTQDLTFKHAVEAFSKKELAFDEAKLNQLGVKQQSTDFFTNLGLLLSDQCQHTIKVAVFENSANTVFLDRKEFSGSVLKQAEDALNYIQLNNKVSSKIEGLYRQDYWDYPVLALREALINAIIHRDYGMSGPIIININQEAIEFISIGGLLPGLTKDDIVTGVSQQRNKNLSSLFLRLDLIEAYGTGLRRIMDLYEDVSRKPEIVIAPNSFKLILPNMNKD